VTINIYVFCEATSCILVAGFSEMVAHSYQDTGCYESITYPVVLLQFFGYCFLFRKGSMSGIKIVFLCPPSHLFLEIFALVNVQLRRPQMPGARSPG
jgi:hypothetical protein